jgi:hypothetical protein
MTIRANGTFDIDGWDASPYNEGQEGAAFSRVHVKKTFHGDLVGTSTADLLMVASPDERSRAYVGLERVEGSLQGRRGSFVVHHTAIGSPDLQAVAWTIVPDTGAGELHELRGTLQIVNEPDGGHSWTLDYELSDVAASTRAE